MLKQGVKTINAELIRTRALSQLSFTHFRPYAISFPRLLLSLTLMQKSKKTMETSLDLTPSFKTSQLTQGLRVLFRMWVIWKTSAVILFKRNMAEKNVCRAHTFRSLNCNFSFRKDVLHRWRLLNEKIN